MKNYLFSSKFFYLTPFFILLLFSINITESFGELTTLDGTKTDGLQQYDYLLDDRLEQTYDGITKYDTGIHLIRVGEIDKKVGSYELNFWFWVTVHEEDNPIDFTVDPPEFIFINTDDVNLSSIIIEPHYYEARVSGKFFGDMDFRNYPFEELNLLVEIEPSYTTPTIDVPVRHKVSDSIVFLLDPASTIDISATIPGWLLEKFSINVEEHEYGDEEINSRFVANFVVERSLTSAILQSILPLVMITTLSISIFWVPGNYNARIYLTAPLLIALVYLHQTSLSSIPPLGYMTVFDKIMLINYSLFVNSILSVVVQMRIKSQYDDPVKIIKANSIMRYFIPVIIIVGLVVFFV